ncbi:unnamed protein product, partial [Prorocentrum cordatum]
VFVDNLDLLEIADEVAMAALQCAGPPGAVDLARARYGAQGIPRSEDKSVSRALKSQVSGVYVDGKLGMISPPKDSIYNLVSLTLFALGRERVGQRWLLVLAGRWVRAMMFRREVASAFDHLWCDLRAPFSGVATASGAGEQEGAVCRAVRLLPRGIEAARAARARRGGRLQGEGVLISFIDGFGGIQNASACRVARRAWPDVLGPGGVRLPTKKRLGQVRDRAPHARWAILGAGAPCVDLARLCVDRRGLRGARSGLFFETWRIQSLILQVFPEEVQLFNLVENVSSMGAKDRGAMSQALGLEPAVIEGADISRARLERLRRCDVDLMAQWQCAVDKQQGIEK